MGMGRVLGEKLEMTMSEPSSPGSMGLNKELPHHLLETNSMFYFTNNTVSTAYLIGKSIMRVYELQMAWHRCLVGCAKLQSHCLRNLGVSLLCEDMVWWHSGRMKQQLISRPSFLHDTSSLNREY